MRYAIITILSIFVVANLGVLGFFYSDMAGGHSFLCDSPLAGNCQPAESGKSMFAGHYLSIIKILSNAEVAGASAATLSLSALLLFYLFYYSAPISALCRLTEKCVARKWKYKIFPCRKKFLRWIAYHNKGDNAASFGLKNYSYV